MKFLDLFAGIGGFRLGLEMAGHECVGHVEIDKYANQSYRAIHQPKESEFFHEDITTITDESIRELRDRGIDIIAGGFPCQAFSIAGARRGFEDTRGTLFFDIARMARIIRPKYLFLENVKGLLNHDNGDTFETILRTLDELRYDTEWSCLNSKDFGVPQNRERVFIVGHLRGRSTRKVFPITGANAENSVELSDGRLGKWMGSNRRVAQEVYSEDGIFPCLTTKSHFNNSPKIAVKDAYYKESNFRIRKLTPKECWRLQGFPDWAFERAKAAGVSDSQLYKQAGNSVTVNVIHEIAKRLK